MCEFWDRCDTRVPSRETSSVARLNFVREEMVGWCTEEADCLLRSFTVWDITEHVVSRDLTYDWCARRDFS